jgi:hypothetical protein
VEREEKKMMRCFIRDYRYYRRSGHGVRRALKLAWETARL